MEMQVRSQEHDGTIVTLITTKSHEEVARLIEFLDLDSVDVYSTKGRDKIKPKGYRIKIGEGALYDRLVKV